MSQIIIRSARASEHDQIARVWMDSWVSTGLENAADITVGSGLHFAERIFKMVPPRPSFDA